MRLNCAIKTERYDRWLDGRRDAKEETDKDGERRIVKKKRGFEKEERIGVGRCVRRIMDGER